jgi:hypothetical protein
MVPDGNVAPSRINEGVKIGVAVENALAAFAVSALLDEDHPVAVEKFMVVDDMTYLGRLGRSSTDSANLVNWPDGQENMGEKDTEEES